MRRGARSTEKQYDLRDPNTSLFAAMGLSPSMFSHLNPYAPLNCETLPYPPAGKGYTFLGPSFSSGHILSTISNEATFLDSFADSEFSTPAARQALHEALKGYSYAREPSKAVQHAGECARERRR